MNRKIIRIHNQIYNQFKYFEKLKYELKHVPITVIGPGRVILTGVLLGDKAYAFFHSYTIFSVG